MNLLPPSRERRTFLAWAAFVIVGLLALLLASLQTGCAYNPLTVAPGMTALPAQPTNWQRENLLDVYDFTGTDEAGTKHAGTFAQYGKANGFLVTAAFVQEYRDLLKTATADMLGHIVPGPKEGIAALTARSSPGLVKKIQPVTGDYWISEQVEIDHAAMKGRTNSPQMTGATKT